MSAVATCTRDECVQLIVDFLEVSAHQILWARKIYPKEVFRQAQKFNTMVYRSIHPEINHYIENTLSTTKMLLLDGYAEKLILVIKDDDKPVERFVFSFISYYKNTPSGKVTFNLSEIKQQARTIWLTMCHRFGSEVVYKGNCTFAFELHTRNVGYDKILEGQSTESFQWIEANKAAIPNGVVPIRKLDSQPFCIDVYAEDYRDDDS